MLLLFKNDAYHIDYTSQEINSKKFHESYTLHILHIKGFPNTGNGGGGGVENFAVGDFDDLNLFQS